MLPSSPRPRLAPPTASPAHGARSLHIRRGPAGSELATMSLCERASSRSSLLWPRMLLFGDSITQVPAAPSAASARMLGQPRRGSPRAPRAVHHREPVRTPGCPSPGLLSGTSDGRVRVGVHGSLKGPPSLPAASCGFFTEAILNFEPASSLLASSGGLGPVLSGFENNVFNSMKK